MSQPGSSTAASSVERNPTASAKPTLDRPEERISIRKSKAIKFGRRIARLRIGCTRETFAIHEELICSQSTYFREKLQKGRKPIEGECSICHDDMDACKKEITFCAKGCGANLHYDCMKSWKEQKNAREEIVKCPLCHRVWSPEVGEQALQCANLDADAFHLYFDWLYHRTISLQEDEAPVLDENAGGKECQDLLNAYLLGAQLQDTTFCAAIMQALLEVMRENNIYPYTYFIRQVYRKTKPLSSIRKFLVEVYISFAKSDWIEEDREDYPAAFLADLSIALLRIRKMDENASLKTVKLKERFCKHGEDIVEELRSDSSDSDSD